MQVTLRRASAVALLAAGGALLSSACVRNESSLFVRACLEIPPDSCRVQASENSSVVLSGSLDGLYRAEYDCVALIENQLVARGDTTKLRTETSRISVYQAEVQVLTNDSTAPTALAQYTIPISGFADPGTGTSPGLGLTNLVLIDAGTTATLVKTVRKTGTVQQVVASVVLHGRTLGGLEVESNEFKFPISVCAGCTCGKPVDNEPCYGSDQAPSPNCLLGQDSVTDCRFLADNPCEVLECDNGDISTAHCPAGGFADKSCCNP